MTNKFEHDFSYKGVDYSKPVITDPAPPPLDIKASFVDRRNDYPHGWQIKAEGKIEITLTIEATGAYGLDSMREFAAYTVVALNSHEIMLRELKRWREFARNNQWTDADHHDADGTGWISALDAAIAKGSGLPF